MDTSLHTHVQLFDCTDTIGIVAKWLYCSSSAEPGGRQQEQDGF